MEKKTYLLETKDNPRIVRILQIIFGIVCIILALFWIIFNFSTIKGNGSAWITILFITSFGIYQILSGLGKTLKYVQTEDQRIIIKQHAVLPAIELKASDIEKIDLYPMSTWFILKTGRKIILRFGISYPEIIKPVEDSIIEFGEANGIKVEVKKEEI
jgi:hypothetical protein